LHNNLAAASHNVLSGSKMGQAVKEWRPAGRFLLVLVLVLLAAEFRWGYCRFAASTWTNAAR